MSYFRKLGCLMRQTVVALSPSQSTAAAGIGAVALPAVFLLQRRMASSKVFIGGLAWGTDEGAIRDAFSSFGVVTEVKTACDRETGRPCGFGFVSFENESEAGAAIQEMDGQVLAYNFDIPSCTPYGELIKALGSNGRIWGAEVYYTGERTPGDRPVGGMSQGVETRALGEVGGECKIKFSH